MALTQVASGLIASVSGASLTGTQTIPKATLPTGSVLQVVFFEYTTAASYAVNNTSANTAITTSITPTSATSKILITAAVSMSTNDVSGGYFWGFKRGSTFLGNPSGGTWNYQFGFLNPNVVSNGSGNIATFSATYLDSPASASAQTYTVYVAGVTGTGTIYINQNSANNARNTSTITLMEIAA
jgi:hypothetical protein